MNVQNLCNPEKREGLLEIAIKRVKAKKGGEYPFVFAMKGRNEAVLVVDWRGETTCDKLMKMMRKERPRKVIIGKARLVGRTLELQTERSKGTVKPQDVRKHLAQRSLPVRKAVIKSASDPPTANRRGPASEDTKGNSR